MKFQFNTKTYILLSIITLNIAYVVYQATYDSENPDKAATVSANENFTIDSENTKNKTFDLLPLTKDPFLGTLRKKTISSQKKKINTTKEKLWPTITYSGVVASNKNTSKIFIITIDGQQVLLSKGEVFQDIKVISGTAKHIQVRFQGVTKKIEM